MQDLQVDNSTKEKKQKQEFDWKKCWYPVTFSQDLPKNTLYSFSLYDRPLVIFRNTDGELSCLFDRCPHRAARLSDGKLLDGKLECLYHGWQFSKDGQCLHIPQLPSDKPIPSNACVASHPVIERQGIVWIWGGNEETADFNTLPTIEAIDKPDVISMDYTIELPYDSTYLIENVIDVAHIHIAHDGMRGGGKREYAKPIEFEILESSIAGIRSSFRSLETTNKLSGAIVEFIAPNLILYTSNYKNPNLISGLALYSLPLGQGKCRLIYRKYSNFWSRRERLKPRWLEHWNQNKILEQDMNVIIGQYESIERSQTSLKDLWLPLKTCDLLVIEYRKWLDSYGASLPFYRGYTTSKSIDRVNLSSHKLTSNKILPNRYNSHTRICSSCQQAYRTIERLKNASIVSIFILFSFAIITRGLLANLAIFLACCLAILSIVLISARSIFGEEKNS
jgi:phenylpropionate dioxygenase-like ring-hydroxylating dioxygenase large terminal subunit